MYKVGGIKLVFDDKHKLESEMQAELCAFFVLLFSGRKQMESKANSVDFFNQGGNNVFLTILTRRAKPMRFYAIPHARKVLAGPFSDRFFIISEVR